MLFSRKKLVLTIAIFLLICAYPISLVMREMWGLSDTFGVAIPSFIIGVAIGFLSCSLIMPGPKKDKDISITNDEQTHKDTPETSE